MMGHRQVEQAALFCAFWLDKHIPADHMLRSIDTFVELGDIRRELTLSHKRLPRALRANRWRNSHPVPATSAPRDRSAHLRTRN